MSSDINLLLKKDKKSLKIQSRLKAFRLMAIASLVVLLLISVIIFLLNQQLSNTSLEKDREAILSEMLAFREKDSKLKVVNNRIENITKTLSKRLDVGNIVNKLIEKVPNGMLVESLEFSEKKISIKVSTGSLVLVDGFINKLIDMAKRKEIIKSLSLESLEVSELIGIYKVSIIINI